MATPWCKTIPYIDKRGRLRERAIPSGWCGARASNQAEADESIPLLLNRPAAVRVVRFEPLLGPVAIDKRLIAPIEGTSQHGQRFIDWVIVGGGGSPMHPDWVRSIRDQCQAAGVPFLFTGWGEWAQTGAMGEFCFNKGATVHDLVTMNPVGKKAAGRLLDGREWNEVPNGGAS
jgi:protein gp37